MVTSAAELTAKIEKAHLHLVAAAELLHSVGPAAQAGHRSLAMVRQGLARAAGKSAAELVATIASVAELAPGTRIWAAMEREACSGG